MKHHSTCRLGSQTSSNEEQHSQGVQSIRYLKPRSCMRASVRQCVHVCLRLRLCVCMCLCLWFWVCMSVCVCVCVCLYEQNRSCTRILPRFSYDMHFVHPLVHLQLSLLSPSNMREQKSINIQSSFATAYQRSEFRQSTASININHIYAAYESKEAKFHLANSDWPDSCDLGRKVYREHQFYSLSNGCYQSLEK